MALLTYSSPPSKGSTVTATLSKTDVVALSGIASDAYWSLTQNISKCVIQLRSSTGKQKKILAFDFTEASPETALSFPLRCRDNFVVSKVTVIDFLDDKVSVLGSVVDLSADDISLV